MTSLDHDVELLRRVPLFSSVSTPKLKLLAFNAPQLVFEDGENVFLQGAAETSAYFIVDGEADVLSRSDGKEVVVANLKKNTLFGEISAFCDVPRTATVRAKGRLVTLELTRPNLIQLIHDFPDVAMEIIRELAMRLTRTTGDLANVLAASGSNKH
jgi:CRP/FNR family cyclic AMP-dependent transcriptional regulator